MAFPAGDAHWIRGGDHRRRCVALTTAFSDPFLRNCERMSYRFWNSEASLNMLQLRKQKIQHEMVTVVCLFIQACSRIAPMICRYGGEWTPRLALPRSPCTTTSSKPSTSSPTRANPSTSSNTSGARPALR
eukprot:1193467-Prorocentrum_minimum.AAC.6